MRVEIVVWVVVFFGVFYLMWEMISLIFLLIIIVVIIVYIFYFVYECFEGKIGGWWLVFILMGILIVVFFLFVFGFVFFINDVKYFLVNYVDIFVGWFFGLNLFLFVYEVFQRILFGIFQRFNSYVFGYIYLFFILFLQVIVIVFLFYGIFVNVDVIKQEVYFLIFLINRDFVRKLIDSGVEMFYIVFRGWLFVGVGKGILMVLFFRVFGIFDVGGVVVVGILMVVIEFFFVVGGWIVWVGGVVYLINQGYIFLGVFLVFFGFFFVLFFFDILLRDKISCLKWGVNVIISFLGFIGGYIVFGFVGIIIGFVLFGFLKIFVEEWKEIKERIF